jgi:hypothetical protein
MCAVPLGKNAEKRVKVVKKPTASYDNYPLHPHATALKLPMVISYFGKYNS